MSNERLTRIAIVDSDKCKPKKSVCAHDAVASISMSSLLPHKQSQLKHRSQMQAGMQKVVSRRARGAATFSTVDCEQR